MFSRLTGPMPVAIALLLFLLLGATPLFGQPDSAAAPAATMVTLHMHGNVDELCSGVGVDDILICDGPFLLESDVLDDAPPARWGPVIVTHDGTAARNIYDPSWIWNLDQPTTLQGTMELEWWGTCGACGPVPGQWTIRLWADLVLVHEEVVVATPPLPNVPALLTASVDLLTPLSATDSFVLHIDPFYIDAQQNTYIYYDSTLGCPGQAAGPCDSLVRMPVLGGPEPTATSTATTVPATATPTATSTATVLPASPTPSATSTATALPASPTPSATATATPEDPATPTATATAEPSMTATATATPEDPATPTATATASATTAPTMTATVTATASPTTEPTITVTATSTASPSPTATQWVPPTSLTLQEMQAAPTGPGPLPYVAGLLLMAGLLGFAWVTRQR